MGKSNENQLWIEDENSARARIKQAQDLKPIAAESGLHFETYLTPDLAEWVLDLVERGVFIDPCEAVFCFMQEARELAPHSDLKDELLRRKIAKAEKGEFIPIEDVEAHIAELEERHKTRPEPVHWHKIDQPPPSE